MLGFDHLLKLPSYMFPCGQFPVISSILKDRCHNEADNVGVTILSNIYNVKEYSLLGIDDIHAS